MKPIFLVVPAVVLILLIGGVLALRLTARPTRPEGPLQPPTPRDTTTLEAIRDLLHKAADYDDCRVVVQQLNMYIDGAAEEKPPALSAAELDLLKNKDQFGLDDGELAEASRTTFTPLDAHYFEQCILIKDAMRSLRLEKLAPLDQAAAAFAWTMRQVRLQERPGDALSVEFVLRRGSGSSLERALVFLAVLQQLGVDGCMLTVPGNPGEPAVRYWIPGALINHEIHLFDTRLGIPLPGPKGQGIATLAQVRKEPETLRQLTVDDKTPYDVSPDQARRAEIHVAVALPALAPRMRYLQERLSGADRLHLGIDPAAVLQRFAAAINAAPMKGVQVRVWNISGDVSNPIRLLRSFVPEDEGGTDKSQRRLQAQQQLIPREYFPRRFANLHPDLQRRMFAAYATPFIPFWTQGKMQREFLLRWLPGIQQPQQQPQERGIQKQNPLLDRNRMPRDLAIRGNLSEAVQVLNLIHDELTRQKEFARNIPDQEIDAWIERANAVAVALDEARRQARGGDREALKRAQEQEQELTRNSGPALALVYKAIADAMDPEVIYLLALCKQEEAERLRARQARSGAQDQGFKQSWESAASWWVTFLEYYASHANATSARIQLACARQALGQREEAAGILEELAAKLSGPEKVGCIYLARKWKGR
jgi:hypothetical protein